MKKFYNGRLLRERVLMLVFLGIGVIWWGTAVAGRVRQSLQVWHVVTQDGDTQKLWLAKGSSVGDRTAQIAKQVDPAKTMNATQAYAEVYRLAQGLPLEMGEQRTDPTENFSLHSVRVTFRRIDMGSLVRFYEGVVARAPYLGIDQCTITSDRAAPGQLNAAFRIYSLEVPHGPK